jgi:hypothetical protein
MSSETDGTESLSEQARPREDPRVALESQALLRLHPDLIITSLSELSEPDLIVFAQSVSLKHCWVYGMELLGKEHAEKLGDLELGENRGTRGSKNLNLRLKIMTLTLALKWHVIGSYRLAASTTSPTRIQVSLNLSATTLVLSHISLQYFTP